MSRARITAAGVSAVLLSFFAVGVPADANTVGDFQPGQVIRSSTSGVEHTVTSTQDSGHFAVTAGSECFSDNARLVGSPWRMELANGKVIVVGQVPCRHHDLGWR